MAQRTKKIALDRSYLPIDPNTLPVTMHDTGREDAPEDRIPVIPFEGWNFMPTGYGWRSYFGISSSIGIDPLALPARCREIFTFQKTDLTTFLVALCDTGIWTKAGESAGAWTQAVVLVDPNDGTMLEWSYAILENALYVYRQGEASAYKVTAPTFLFTVHTPNTLNMAGQLGIFKAGGRLGFWDSADSIAHSSFTDYTDFVPSVGTLANITTLKEKIGKIINVVQHGDGFIVYATKSIIGVIKDLSNTFLWRTQVISNVAGIAYRHQVAIGSPDTEHYAWTSIGLMRIRNFQSEIIVPELYDFLKETQDPIYLKVLEGRYVAAQIANSAYVDGILSFFTQTIEGEVITLAEAFNLWATIPNFLVTAALTDAQAKTYYTLFNTQPAQTAVESEEGGCAGIGFCAGKDYGVYEDNFVSPVTPVAQLAEVLKSGLQANFNSAPFSLNGKTRNLGSIAQPIGTLETSLGGVPVVNKDYTGNLIIISPNEKNFYDKITAIWDTYNSHLLGYVTKLKHQLTELDSRLLTTGAIPSASTLVIDKGAPTLPVPLGRKGPFHDEVLAAITMTPTVGGAITVASNTDKYAGNLPYNYELEYGKIGYTYYSIAKPVNEMIYTGQLTKNFSKLAAPFKCSVVLTTGSGAAAAGLTVTGTAIQNWETVYQALITLIEGVGLTIADVAGASGIPTAHYMQGGIDKFQDGLAGLTVKDQAGAAWAPDAEGVLLTFNVTDPAVGTVTINSQAQNLSGADDLNVTFSDAAIAAAYCARNQYISYTHPTSFVRFSVDGNASPSPNTPPAYSEAAVLTASLCGQVLDARPRPTLYGMSISAPSTLLPKIDVIINKIRFLVSQTPLTTFTFPTVSFLMQAGAPAPYTITWKGAYVYDTHLKRWGKMKQDFQQLLDFSPLNSTALKTVPFTQFGLQAALLDDAGLIHTFDSLPGDSYLKFGKYGNFRQGYTSLETIRADFRQPCSGILQVEPSFDGRTVDVTNTKNYNYSNATQIVQGHGMSARWHNVAFLGQFDLSYLELTSHSMSRR